jgi:hypothetical protein
LGWLELLLRSFFRAAIRIFLGAVALLVALSESEHAWEEAERHGADSVLISLWKKIVAVTLPGWIAIFAIFLLFWLVAVSTYDRKSPSSTCSSQIGC